MKDDLPSPELLRKLLRYDPETGELFWRERSREMFYAPEGYADRLCKSWNSRHANNTALGSPKGNGYLQGNIFNRAYLAHRVAFAIYTGRWPLNEIDHINGNRSDNRIANLREATRQENSKNVRLHCDSMSGACGVQWVGDAKKWRARITVCGKEVSLGRFSNFEDAVNARKIAEREYGYSRRHGKAESA